MKSMKKVLIALLLIQMIRSPALGETEKVIDYLGVHGVFVPEPQYRDYVKAIQIQEVFGERPLPECQPLSPVGDRVEHSALWLLLGLSAGLVGGVVLIRPK